MLDGRTKHPSILKKQMKPLRKMQSTVNATHTRLIGDQITKLFKDDHLYETGLIDDPNFKLQSLRDFSHMDIAQLAASQDEGEHD